MGRLVVQPGLNLPWDNENKEEWRMTTWTFQYTGSPAFAGRFAQMLRDEGLTVQWEPPMEQRGLGDVVQQVEVVTGTTALAKAAWARIKPRLRSGERVEVQPPLEEDPPT
jgi:hypothetical protein